MGNQSQDSFDAAALAMATLAGAGTLFTKSGPYDWLSALMGMTLLFILFAYKPNLSTFSRVLAFSASAAFAALLVVASIVEFVLAFVLDWPLKEVPVSVVSGLGGERTVEYAFDSRLPALVVAGLWLGSALGLFHTHKGWQRLAEWRQRRKEQRTSAPQKTAPVVPTAR